ncbi:hypothetical protein C8R43DRAFT_956422 [Mycena crocata]|nr:hypothetical protein C8R43DRAFT_956422 [Mycena crocata]
MPTEAGITLTSGFVETAKKGSGLMHRAIQASNTAKYLGSSSPGSGVGIRLGVAEGWQEEKWFEWHWDCGGKRQVAKLDAAWLAHLIIMIDLWVFSLLEPDWNRTLKSMRGFYLRIRREMVFSHLQNTYGYIFGTFWSLDTRSLLQLWQVKFQFATWLCAFATCSLSQAVGLEGLRTFGYILEGTGGCPTSNSKDCGRKPEHKSWIPTKTGSLGPMGVQCGDGAAMIMDSICYRQLLGGVGLQPQYCKQFA